jgi:hypothetical protein
MKRMNQKLAVLAVGIACTFGSLGVASAATVSAPTAQSLAPMSEAGQGTVELVKIYPHGGGGGGGGSGHRPHVGGSQNYHPGGGNGWKSYSNNGKQYYGKNDGKHHHRHHRHGGSSFFFYGSPFYYDDGYYGYSPYYSPNSCYRECRYYHGPRYCRHYWRRFCE